MKDMSPMIFVVKRPDNLHKNCSKRIKNFYRLRKRNPITMALKNSKLFRFIKMNRLKIHLLKHYSQIRLNLEKSLNRILTKVLKQMKTVLKLFRSPGYHVKYDLGAEHMWICSRLNEWLNKDFKNEKYFYFPFFFIEYSDWKRVFKND